jgi:hypothetical protein
VFFCHVDYFLANANKKAANGWYLCRMISNFKAVVGEQEFTFHTMNSVRLQAFQVYVMHDGKKSRFHLQLNGQGVFFITDITACPEPYRGLETALSEAVLANNLPPIVVK